MFEGADDAVFDGAVDAVFDGADDTVSAAVMIPGLRERTSIVRTEHPADIR